MSYTVHTVESAPADSRPALEAIQSRYGFLPNLAATVAESPGALNGLLASLQAYDDPALTLTPLERQIVLIATSVENRCDFCVAAHSMLASSLGLERAQIERLQDGLPLADERLEALRVFTTEIVRQRGWIEPLASERFFAAGFDRGQVFEVVLGVALKTLTNYINHIAGTEVNSQFADFAPKRASAA